MYVRTLRFVLPVQIRIHAMELVAIGAEVRSKVATSTDEDDMKSDVVPFIDHEEIVELLFLELFVYM